MPRLQTKTITYRKRSHQFNFRASYREADIIRHKIADSGLSAQEYLLLATMSAYIVNTERLKKFIPELKRIGSNINQIAKKANMTDVVTTEEIISIRKDIDDIWQLLKQYMQNPR